MITTKTLAALAAILVLAACGGHKTEPDPAYFGTWKYTQEHNDDFWVQVTISADKLVSFNQDGVGYTISGLTWTKYAEPTDDSVCPTGYKITGTLTANEGYALLTLDGNRKAEVGEQTIEAWYISTDGQSLAQGDWYSPYSSTAFPFVKQSEVPAAETTNETETRQTHEIDRTEIPKFEWSKNGIVDMGRGVRILLPTGHWAVSPQEYEPLLGEEWHELVCDSITGRHQLRVAELHLERGYNECWGDSTVHVGSAREALLFIHGLAANEDLPTVALNKRRVWPGEELSFAFGDATYKLRGEGVSGDTGTRESERWDDEVVNYKLLFSDGSGKEQLIVAVPSFEHAFMAIRWIGDLDGDRKPDLLLDISTHYEQEVVVLYLSSLAEDGELVGAAAVSCEDFSC